MSDLSEKLLLTLATKENIKQAIENKGVSVGDIPFSEYPTKIANIGIDSTEWKELDWHDIVNIRLSDTENYLYKSIYLLDDSENTILLLGGQAYKTSDSSELILKDGEYVFTGEGDKKCSKGYKTRWVIVYKNYINNILLDYTHSNLLYTIQDGINTLQDFLYRCKLRYVECEDGVTTIELNAFSNCESLLWISNIHSVTVINNRAFFNCRHLKGIELEGNYALGTEVFYGCMNLEKLVLRDVEVLSELAIWGSYIKKLILGITSKSLVIPRVDYLEFDEVYTIPDFSHRTYGDTYIGGTSSSGSVYYYNSLGTTHVNLKSIDLSEISTNSLNVNRFTFEEMTIGSTEISMPYLKLLTSTYSSSYTLAITNSFNLQELYIPYATGTLSLYNAPKLSILEAPKVTGIQNFYNVGIEEIYLPKVITISYTSSLSLRYSYSSFSNLPRVTKISLPSLTLTSVSSSSYLLFLENCPKLKIIEFPKIVSIPMYSIKNCGLESLTIPKTVSYMGSMSITNLPNLKTLIFEDGFDGKHGNYTFYGSITDCPVLEYLYLPASITLSMTTGLNAQYYFGYNCPKLTTIELGLGYSKTLYLRNIRTLTKECVVNILNALADLTGSTKLTLYIYSNTLSLLSDEEKAIATNKNWTLAS